MKLFNHINDQGGKVKLKGINTTAEFGTAMDMFQQTRNHEQFITRSIQSIGRPCKC